MIADQGVCDEEAIKSDTRQVEGRSALWLASSAVLAFLSLKDVIHSNRLIFLHPTCHHLMRCKWCYGCPSPNQLLWLIPAILDSDHNKSFSKAGMMEEILFVTIRLIVKRFDWGNYLCNLDRRLLLEQYQGVLLPEQEKTMTTIHVNLGHVNLGLWALFIPRGKITEQGAVATSQPRRLVAVLTHGVPGYPRYCGYPINSSCWTAPGLEH